MLPVLGNVLGAITAPVTEWVKGRQELSKIKTEGKINTEIARQQAKIEIIKSKARMAQDYDLAVLENQNNTWRDELLTLVFTMPFLLSFLAPFIDVMFDINVVNGVSKAWETVGIAPAWYQWTILGIVAATFGLRWLFAKSNPLVNKRG